METKKLFLIEKNLFYFDWFPASIPNRPISARVFVYVLNVTENLTDFFFKFWYDFYVLFIDLNCKCSSTYFQESGVVILRNLETSTQDEDEDEGVDEVDSDSDSGLGGSVPPCSVTFIGANVSTGKSSMRLSKPRDFKKVKQNRIKKGLLTRAHERAVKTTKWHWSQVYKITYVGVKKLHFKPIEKSWVRWWCLPTTLLEIFLFCTNIQYLKKIVNLNFGAKTIEFENFFEPGLSDNLNHRAKIRDFGKLQNQLKLKIVEFWQFLA